MLIIFIFIFFLFFQTETTLSTNDIVINKLTQILSYLRHGVRASKKQKKREKELIRGNSSHLSSF